MARIFFGYVMLTEKSLGYFMLTSFLSYVACAIRLEL